MRLFNKLVLAGTVLLMAVSCNNSFEAGENQFGTSESQDLVFTGIIGGEDESKTRLVDGKSVYWIQGDEISINGVSYLATPKEDNARRATFTKESAQGGNSSKVGNKYKAYYPASLYNGGTPTLPATQTYSADAQPFPMYSESENEILTFKNICAILKITVPEKKTVKQVQIFSDKAVSGTFTITSDGVITMTGETNADKYLTLDCGSGAEEGKILYVAIPPQTYNNLKVRLVLDDNTKLKRSIISSSKALERNKIYSVLNDDFEEDDTYGPFSVSADKYVFFSPGNLQAVINASGTATSWKFAEHQWECIGANVANTSIGTSAGTVDLFGWSTNATNNNWGIHTKTSSTDGYTDGDFEDWGQKIGDGTTWRTLTGGSDGEWNYLLSTRKVTVGGIKKSSYGEGSVKGVKGLIILPDNWDGSVCGTFAYGQTAWSNTFTESTTPKWSDMEAAGCVFLPAAGYRQGSGYSPVSSVGSYAYYWSSTPSGANYAYDLYFYKNNVYPANSDRRYVGYSVRLVQDAN